MNAIEALLHDPDDSAAWYNLGASMSATDQVRVNGANYTKRQCVNTMSGVCDQAVGVLRGLGVEGADSTAAQLQELDLQRFKAALKSCLQEVGTRSILSSAGSPRTQRETAVSHEPQSMSPDEKKAQQRVKALEEELAAAAQLHTQLMKEKSEELTAKSQEWESAERSNSALKLQLKEKEKEIGKLKLTMERLQRHNRIGLPFDGSSSKGQTSSAPLASFASLGGGTHAFQFESQATTKSVDMFPATTGNMGTDKVLQGKGKSQTARRKLSFQSISPDSWTLGKAPLLAEIASLRASLLSQDKLIEEKDAEPVKREKLISAVDRWAEVGGDPSSLRKSLAILRGISIPENPDLEALKQDPNCSDTWCNLGASMSAADQVRVNGANYTKRQCYVEALKHDANCSDAWCNLGADMDATEEVQVNGANYTEQQCFIEALTHNPERSDAWFNLGASMNATNQVQVKGSNRTKRHCYIEALTHGPKCSGAWFNLGAGMNAMEEVQVNGAKYTRQQCYIEALTHDPNCSDAWAYLGAGLSATESVLVKGTSYTKKECYLRALAQGPNSAVSSGERLGEEAEATQIGWASISSHRSSLETSTPSVCIV
jgi:hypothetical protein